jgi:hypothetical protein
MLRIVTDNNKETWILVIIFILVAKQIYIFENDKGIPFIYLINLVYPNKRESEGDHCGV